jgi:hypothetical protein
MRTPQGRRPGHLPIALGHLVQMRLGTDSADNPHFRRELLVRRPRSERAAAGQ